MQKVLTITEVIRSNWINALKMAAVPTYLMLLGNLVGSLELQSFNIAALINDITSYQTIGFVVIVYTFVYFWNFISVVLGLYLFTSSLQLSGKYNRLLLVILGVIFIGTFFHIFPVPAIPTHFGWLGSFFMRLFQAYSLATMLVVAYAIVQSLVIYIIGFDK